MSRLQVKEVQMPITGDVLLGNGIDVMTLPEGHLSCSKCGKHLFECWVYLDTHRLEMGCQSCGHSYRLLFPLDIDLMRFGKNGRFTCKKHPDKGFVLIHNMDVISIGCEKCTTEVQVILKTKNNLVIAND